MAEEMMAGPGAAFQMKGKFSAAVGMLGGISSAMATNIRLQ